MRTALRRAAATAACLAALALVGCGQRVSPDAPITFAPADTPWLVANFKPVPADLAAAWAEVADVGTAAQVRQLGAYARMLRADPPSIARVLDAVQAELADVHSRAGVARTLGLAQSGLFAFYGIGDVPVLRVELASPDVFKAFWQRVEQRAGISAPTANINRQDYWTVGGADARVNLLVAIEGRQLVVTLAPTGAGADMLKALLGLAKPGRNAVDRLARINGEHGYTAYGSGYLDLPRLFANLFDGKDAVTRAFAKGVGAPPDHPACASEFASLARQVPVASMGTTAYTTRELRRSLDIGLAAGLRGALAALRQPVPGMEATPDASLFNWVMALPVQKWQAFLAGRAKAAATKAWQCPALQRLNQFARTAANPPVQLPPELDSLLGFRLVLDQPDQDWQIAGRVLVASSDARAWAGKVEQTLPQFALKSIPSDGKPVAFDLPPNLRPMLGGSGQGWIAANAHAVAIGVGDDEGAKLPEMLGAAAGHGDTLLRMHADGRMYPWLAGWIERFAAPMPPDRQAEARQTAAMLERMGRAVASQDLAVKVDDTGFHVQIDTRLH